MSNEPECQAHVQCHVCSEVVYHKDALSVDDKPICGKECKDAYYRITTPRPRGFGYFSGG